MASSSSSPPPPSSSSHLLALPSTQFQGSPTKKPPPLPWTHQETLNLIQSYQQKWYSLKRGQLKATQWEHVSSAVPTKTSTQCRHKMEKLRKRYRAERLKPYPNSWPYFQLMDNMERGPFPFPAQPLSAVKMPNHPMLPDPTNFYHNVDSDSEDHHFTNGGPDGRKNKSKSINHIYSINGTGRDSRVGGGNERGVMGKAVIMDGRKRRGDYEDSEDEKDDEDEEVDVDGEGGVDVGAADGGKELAQEIRGFAEKFITVEKMKIEMTRETERYRMEMERKRMEMILDSQRKIVDTIGRAFRAHKKLNTGPEL